MSKQRNEGEGAEDPKTEIKTKRASLDLENGVVVFDTNAEDGTGFTLLIEEQKVKADAKDGQVWFYAGSAIAPDSLIHLL